MNMNGHNNNNTPSSSSTSQQQQLSSSPAIPFAILVCQKNSHPFQERKINLDTPLKIGRAVAKARPGPENAIFDCKVLSRNHAVLWYEEGKVSILHIQIN